MPYALIPDGYSLTKITKAQEAAVNAKRRHDDVVAAINNPEIIKQLVIVVTGYLALKEAQDFWEWASKEGVEISQDVKDEYTRKRIVGGAPVGVSIEDLLRAAPGEIAKRIPFL
jgi:hypothetical protein